MKKNKKAIHTIRLVIVILMAVAIAFSALAPVFGTDNGKEKEKNEIREEISLIREEIENILEELTKPLEEVTKMIPVSGVPAGVSFDYDLRERATGKIVRYLQVVLNADPETRIAQSGGGSPGRETNYFGQGTKNALIKFQRKHGLPTTGFLGSQTRAKLNEVLRNGVVVKETIKRDTEEIRNRFMEVSRKAGQIRERINALNENGEEENG